MTLTKSAEAIEKTPLELYVAPEKPSLVGMTRVELAAALGSVGVPNAQCKMRVQQLWHWIYFRGFTSFEDMTSVSKELRATLAEHFTLARPEIVAEQVSVDGTRKWLLRLPGEVQGERPHEVECVTSQTPSGARCAYRARLAARLIARSATPGRSGSSVILRRARLSARYWPRGIVWATGRAVRGRPTASCRAAIGASRTS